MYASRVAFNTREIPPHQIYPLRTNLTVAWLLTHGKTSPPPEASFTHHPLANADSHVFNTQKNSRPQVLAIHPAQAPFLSCSRNVDSKITQTGRAAKCTTNKHPPLPGVLCLFFPCGIVGRSWFSPSTHFNHPSFSCISDLYIFCLFITSTTVRRSPQPLYLVSRLRPLYTPSFYFANADSRTYLPPTTSTIHKSHLDNERLNPEPLEPDPDLQ